MSFNGVDFSAEDQIFSHDPYSDDSVHSDTSDDYEKALSSKACFAGDIEQVKKDLADGGTCSLDNFKDAILSGNSELILLLLNKDKINLFWKVCDHRISALKSVFPSKIEDLLEVYPEPPENSFIDSSDSSDEENNLLEGLNNSFLTIFEKDNAKVFKILWESAEYVHYQGGAILQLALNMGSAKICKYLLFIMQIEVPELKNIQMQFNLSLKNFLPIIHLKTTQENKENIKAFLKLNFNEICQQKYQSILQHLLTNKCTIMEMVLYLALKGKEEDLNEIDEFGLYPVDYAILGCSYDILNKNFFHFLQYCKVNITLGHRTVLHLACFLDVGKDFISTILEACEECLPKVKIQKNLIHVINLEDQKIRRRLSWRKSEFFDRTDLHGLTAIHYAVWTHDQKESVEIKTLYSTHKKEICHDTITTVALLLQAGAKGDLASPFLQFSFGEFQTTPVPTFMRTVFQKEIEEYVLSEGVNVKDEFLQLTPLELAQKKANEDKFEKMIKLLTGEIKPDEILNPSKPINRFLDSGGKRFYH